MTPQTGGSYERMPDGPLRTAIPEPFWERSWRTWFRYKPMCCGRIFPNYDMYQGHYIRVHLFAKEDPDADQ